ncbi:pantetheine-phosphate adenylyltransferase [bacterium]|nr:pantetheine-phosphate adenylyltransferase [bacterium]
MPTRKRKAVYAGSFDPPTEGHMYMIREGSFLFDELVVAIGVNPDKRSLFTLEERLQLLRAVTRDFQNVSVSSFEARYLIDYAAREGARYILRGIRNASDFHYEQTMRNVNADRNSNVTTVFLVPPRELAEVSSSFVKGLVGPRGWKDFLKNMVPAPVHEALLKKFAGQKGGDDAEGAPEPGDPEG